MSKVKTAGRNILGDEETSGSQEDESSPDNSINFASAEREDGATDYGLEFTNTNNGSPLMNIAGRQRSQETPVTRHARIDREAREQVPGTNSKSVPGTSLALVVKNKNPPQKQQTAAARKPRKQNNPVQREKRFLQDVRNLQNQPKMLMPRLPFSRLVRELIMAHSVEATKIARSALEALQEASEMYLTQQLQDAYTLTLHRGRQTLSVLDMELLRFIRGRF